MREKLKSQHSQNMRNFTWDLSLFLILDTVKFLPWFSSALCTAPACPFFTSAHFSSLSSPISLINAFVSDNKITSNFIVLRVSRLPKNYNEKLEAIVRVTLYYIVIIHLLFAIWMYGNTDIFDPVIPCFSRLIYSRNLIPLEESQSLMLKS